MTRSRWINLLLALALGITLLLLWHMHAQLGEAAGQTTELTGTPPGVHISVLSGGQGEKVAQALDAKIWRFRIAIPRGVQLKGGLEIRQPGKPTQVIRPLQLGSTAGATQQILFGIAPTESSLDRSPKLKTFYEMSTSDSNARASGPHKNPFNGCFGLAWGSPLRQQDGTWLLMSGVKKEGESVSWPPSDNDVSLILRLDEVKS